MAHTTLVDVDIEAAPKLAFFIANLIENAEEGTQFLAQAQEMINNAQTVDLLLKFLEKSDIIIETQFEQGNNCNILLKLLL
jgi:hypothetical protein